MGSQDQWPLHVRQAMEGAARLGDLFHNSGVSRLIDQAAAMQRQYEKAIGTSSLQKLIEATRGGALDRLAVEAGYAARILDGSAVSAALKPAFPACLDAARLAQAGTIAGIGSDLAMARRQFESLNDTVLARFGASNAVLAGLGETRLPELISLDGPLAKLQSTIAEFAARDADLWQKVTGYHVASQLAVARIQEAFAAHEHWASLGMLRNLNALATAYDRLVGDLALSTPIPQSLFQQLPAELFGHTTLLDLLRYEPDLDGTADAREGFVDETRRQFRLLVEDRYPELLEHVRAATEARATRGPGWAAAFCLALRRLVDHAHEIVAPMAAVRAWPLLVDATSGKSKKLKAKLFQRSGTPTMFARILFAAKGDPMTDLSLPTFVGTDFNGLKLTLKLINTHIHHFSVPVDEAALDLAQARAECYALFILLLPSKES